MLQSELTAEGIHQWMNPWNRAATYRRSGQERGLLIVGVAVKMQLRVEPDVLIGLVWLRTVQNPMRTSGSTFQGIRFRSENLLRLIRYGW
jgi:hypothetical protein